MLRLRVREILPMKNTNQVKVLLALPLLAGLLAGQAPKTADGQPDVQGFWAAEVGGTYSLVNPRRGGGRLREQLLEREGKKSPTQQSRITDPADGQIPYQPWARGSRRFKPKSIGLPSRSTSIRRRGACRMGPFARSSGRLTRSCSFLDTWYSFTSKTIRTGSSLWMGDRIPVKM